MANGIRMFFTDTMSAKVIRLPLASISNVTIPVDGEGWVFIDLQSTAKAKRRLLCKDVWILVETRTGAADEGKAGILVSGIAIKSDDDKGFLKKLNEVRNGK